MSYRTWFVRKRYFVLALWPHDKLGWFVGYVSHARLTLAEGVAALQSHIAVNAGNGAVYTLVRARRKPLGALP